MLCNSYQRFAVLFLSLCSICAFTLDSASPASGQNSYSLTTLTPSKAPYRETAARGCAPLKISANSAGQAFSGQEVSADTIVSRVPKVTGRPGLYFVCERKLAMRGKRISASDWLGKTSKELAYGDRGVEEDRLYSEAKLFERIKGEVDASGRPLTVFVHGCCVSFSEDLIQANDIHQALQAEGLNGPLLAYDWATPCFNYAGSLAKLPGCRTGFSAFLDRLVKELGRDKIVIVAHSLGIHAVQDYCQHAYARDPEPQDKVFAAVVLSRPDVDVSSFKQSEEAIKKYSGKLMLLCAANDINLKLSSVLRRAGCNFGDDPKPRQGNHLRLGQASVASGLAESFSVYDISPLKLKHLIPYKLIASLLTGETTAFSIERADCGLLQVKRR
jgi:hypothetical protein